MALSRNYLRAKYLYQKYYNYINVKKEHSAYLSDLFVIVMSWNKHEIMFLWRECDTTFTT